MYKIVKKQRVFASCPTAMCHASTVLRNANGVVLAAWFGGSREGKGDTAIWLARKEKDSFDIPQIAASSNEAHWNPVLFSLDDKTIILFYKVGNLIQKWRTMYRVSKDAGNTFSEEHELVEKDFGGRGPVKNKPVRLSNGTILAPGSTEDGIWKAFADASNDNGYTWEKSGDIVIPNLFYEKGKRTIQEDESEIPVTDQSFYGRGIIQPTLWESTPGNVHMLLRSTEGKIFRSDSCDYGNTWSDAYETELPNNNSGIDVVKLKNGNLVLAYNPVGMNWGKRTPLSLAVSKDNGTTWERLLDLDGGEGEFSYPAIISHDNHILVTYTYKRTGIAFWEIEV